jgi:integral membrane protein
MINTLLKTALGRLRIVAFLEGCSFLLLGFTMILKYKYAMPQPNYVVGLAHGILFVLYVVLVFQVSFLHKWNLLKMFWAFLASLIPFGTFYADKVLFRELGK